MAPRDKNRPLKQNQEHEFNITPNSIKIWFDWEFIDGNRFDLDATVVIIENTGYLSDAVYYGKTWSDCKAIHHLGDQRDGKEEHDETITINLNKLEPNVGFLAVMINSYNG